MSWEEITPTEVETLQECLYWQTFWGCSHCHVILQRKSQRLPNLTTHTLNEACRKTAGTLSPHGSLHMPDKGYDSVTHKNICRNHGLNAIIQQRRTLPMRDSIRIMIEIAIGRFDKFRRIIFRGATLESRVWKVFITLQELTCFQQFDYDDVL